MSAVCSLCACGDQPRQQWETTVQGAYSASLSNNGDYALIGSIQHGGSLWRLSDGERLYNWNHVSGQPSEIIASTFSTDNLFALTAERKRFVLWDLGSGRPGGFWPLDGGILALALSNQGRYAIIGQENYSAAYIDLATGSLLATLSHSGDVNTVAISADGKIGATGSEDGLVKVWDLPAAKEIFAYQLGDDVSSVALSLDGSLVFAAKYFGKGHIWEVRTGKEIAEVGHSRTTITAARFAQDNSGLLTGFTARRMVLWEVKSGKALQNWRADAPLFWRPSGLVVTDVAFGKRQNQYLTMFSNGEVYDW